MGNKTLPMTRPSYRYDYLRNAEELIAKVVGTRGYVQVEAVHDLSTYEDIIVVSVTDEKGKHMFRERKDDFPTDQLLTSVALLWG